jgi:inner membrane protein
MIYKTHVIFAESIAFSPFILEKIGILDSKYNIWNNYTTSELLIFMTILAVSALLPDLDEEKSWLSKKIPFISFFTGQLQHRGLTHYLITPIIIYLIGMQFISTENIIILQVVVLGWFLHILGDSFTKSAIPNGWFPLKKTFTLIPKAFRFKTYGTVEMIFLLPTLTIIYFYEVYLMVVNNGMSF